MAVHVFDVTTFRLLFPAFADEGAYPDTLLALRWTSATVYISAADGPLLSDAPLQLALNQMTAHLQASADLLAAGSGAVVVKGSTVGKVSVMLEPPPTKNAWQFWLATTPYGLALWALLKSQAAGGFYAGGHPERHAFRKVGGRFG